MTNIKEIKRQITEVSGKSIDQIKKQYMQSGHQYDLRMKAAWLSILEVETEKAARVSKAESIDESPAVVNIPQFPVEQVQALDEAIATALEIESQSIECEDEDEDEDALMETLEQLPVENEYPDDELDLDEVLLDAYRDSVVYVSQRKGIRERIDDELQYNAQVFSSLWLTLQKEVAYTMGSLSAAKAEILKMFGRRRHPIWRW